MRAVRISLHKVAGVYVAQFSTIVVELFYITTARSNATIS